MKNENTDLNNYEYNEKSLNDISKNTVKFEQVQPDSNSKLILDKPYFSNIIISNISNLFIIFLIVQLIVLLIINIMRKNKIKVIIGIISCIFLIISMFFRSYFVSEYVLTSIIKYGVIIGILGLLGVIYCFPKNRKKN